MKRRDLTALNFKLLEDKKINQIYFRFRENILQFKINCLKIRLKNRGEKS